MNEKKFPKFEAGRLACAATKVLDSKGEELGVALRDLRLALQDYDEAIIALTQCRDNAP